MTRTYETPLKRILREEGRKQSWLADRVGVSESYVSYIVRGTHPEQSIKDKIADALGRTPEELWPTEVAA